MKILDFDANIYEEILKCKSLEQLADVTAELAQVLISWQKILNDLLQNLDSDNIASIDFSKIKVLNGDKI